MMPIPISMALVQSIAAGFLGGGVRTQRGKVHEARKDNSPKVCGVDNVATVDLGGEKVLDIQVIGCGIK